MSDDTITVFEPPVRNSGIDGGKFLERQKIKKPNQTRYPTQISEVYTYRDLYVGQVVCFNSYVFHLYDADEYCFRFMEQNPSMFPYSNIDSIRNKLLNVFGQISQAELTKMFQSAVSANDQQDSILFDDFFRLVKANFGNQLNEQEITTIGRAYSYKKTSEFDFQSLIAVAQDHLRKHNFENFSKLKEALVSRDYQKSLTLTQHEVRNACKSMHLPIPDYVLNILIEK